MNKLISVRKMYEEYLKEDLEIPMTYEEYLHDKIEWFLEQNYEIYIKENNMEKQIMILSQGFEGDRHVITFEEAKQEVYDIALNDKEESEEYLTDYPTHTIFDFAKFIQCCFDKDINNGYSYEFNGVTYQILDDETIEQLWKELGNIPFDENEKGELILAEDWFIFDKSTEREDIWHWFDEYHFKGVGWLMNEYKE